jgi:Restriction endonuclease
MMYNFRIDRSQREFLKRELEENSVLYQGWGQYDLTSDRFIEETKKHYKMKSTRTPSSLSKMKAFKDGDILLVPHFPENGLLMIAVVDEDYPGCYNWTVGQPRHLNHGIKVKKVYGLHGEISMYNQRLVEWYGKLSGLRLPIIALNGLEETVSEMVTLLEADPDVRFGKSSMDDYLADQTDKMLDSLLDQLQRLSPSRSDLSFEKVCEDLLLRHGYDFVRRNYYNGKKGDADLVLKKKNSSHSPFEVGEYYLFVQIKKHRGETDDHAVDQLINIMGDGNEYSPSRGCVISLAESFSEAALKKAAKAGIQMINGPEITKILAYNALRDKGQ